MGKLIGRKDGAAVPAARSRSSLRMAVGAVAALIGSVMFAAPAPAQMHPPGLIPPGDWTEEQIEFLLDLIERTEEALEAYGDPDMLDDLGFVDFGATAPGGYDHWINPDFITDEHIVNPEFPESLVFQNTPGGGYQLVSAMFIAATWDDIPEELAWLPGWHNHPDLCADNFQFTGFADANGECASGSPILTPMMHVWIVDNECGHRFAGIDQFGLHCDVSHGHDDGHDDGHGDGHDDGHDDGHEDGHDERHEPSPARPVRTQPTLTG